MTADFVPSRPRLRAELRVSAAGAAELHTPGGVLDVEPPDGMTQDDFVRLLGRLDGRTTVEALAGEHGLDGGLVREVVAPAVVWGLVDDGAPAPAAAGLAVLSRLEDVFHRQLEDLIFAGPFWQAVLERPETVHHNVFHGFGLENWFFLFRENEFDAAVLALAENAEMRTMLNGFYHEEHRHDDIVVRAFEPLGVTKDQLVRARPLPTTSSLIRLLSWWARTDPLFFLATIGILEGRLDSDTAGADGQIAYDAFLSACDRVGVDAGFVGPMREHARVNAGHDHASVSRELFALVPGVDEDTERRWVAKAHLFMEAYAEFFNGILQYYSDPSRPLLRTVDI
ncbi:hypothetical protein ACQPZF_23940 [Actinosynnema sp. CS-041913]|uniref:hypothetical protein n=1 Tax=Actinosynnema sp. CS-041913 TaxID=3239917 RepID=UPI003D8F9230